LKYRRQSVRLKSTGCGANRPADRDKAQTGGWQVQHCRSCLLQQPCSSWASRSGLLRLAVVQMVWWNNSLGLPVMFVRTRMYSGRHPVGAAAARHGHILLVREHPSGKHQGARSGLTSGTMSAQYLAKRPNRVCRTGKPLSAAVVPEVKG